MIQKKGTVAINYLTINNKVGRNNKKNSIVLLFTNKNSREKAINNTCRTLSEETKGNIVKLNFFVKVQIYVHGNNMQHSYQREMYLIKWLMYTVFIVVYCDHLL